MNNYTLSNAEMLLVQEFADADAEYGEATKVVTGMASDHPAHDAATDAWNRAWSKRQAKAAVFAVCVAGSIGNV